MPYYFFDLVVDEEFKHQGGLILENIGLASDRAEQLANELCVVLPELKKRAVQSGLRIARTTSCVAFRSIRLQLGCGPLTVRGTSYKGAFRF